MFHPFHDFLSLTISRLLPLFLDFSTVILRTKGCISNSRCNGSRTEFFAPNNNSSIALSNMCCDTEDRCNHAPGLPAMLWVVVGAALVALGSRYTQ